ncbi:hypothetical protein KY366_08840 [Candidatus Woesearchaeota archaeon]|nr:hypothetical protein [Candidatus Woesearchaeota archaeon]
MGKENKWLIGKILLISVMLAMLLIKKNDPQSIWMASGIIAGIIIIAFFRFKHPERYRSDERLERLGSRAALLSWTSTFILVTFLYWMDYLGFISLTATQLITSVFWMMIITIMGFRFYLLRKPDIR